MSDRIEQAIVYDATADKMLRRVAENPGPKEYTLAEDGTFTFSPLICGKRDAAGNLIEQGHELHLNYHVVGPRVTRFGVKETRRP